jgi:hypothetical protein
MLLGFLTGSDVASYLTLEFPGHRFPADFATRIHSRTEGNPLFLVKLLLNGRNWVILQQ